MSQVPPEGLRKLMAKVSAMRKHTSDETLIQQWQFVEDGQEEIHFILEGQISWRTQRTEPLPTSFGALFPHLDHPPPSTWFMPKARNQYGLSIHTEPFRTDDVEASHTRLRDSRSRAALVAEMMSLATGKGVRVIPARRIELSRTPTEPAGEEPDTAKFQRFFPVHSFEEGTSAIIDDSWLESISRAVAGLAELEDPELRQVLRSAISWHATANNIFNPSRFVQYWASIELLGTFFYEYLDPSVTQRPSTDSRHRQILEQLLGIDGTNYLDRLQTCQELLQPTARQKILALARIVVEDRQDLRRTLFARSEGRPANRDRSLYDIRNDIAHGNVSPLSWEYFERHTERLASYQQASANFIFAVIKHLPKLAEMKRP